MDTRAIGLLARPGRIVTESGRPMSLAAGSRLGPCEIQSLIGAGGMAEVAEVAASPARLERFEREAKAVASTARPQRMAQTAARARRLPRRGKWDVIDGALAAIRTRPAWAGFLVTDVRSRKIRVTEL